MSTELAPWVAIDLAAVEPFDYAPIAPAVAADLRAQAKQIRQRIAKTTADMIEIGRDLAATKQHLDHGQFTKWLESEVGIPERTARAYMAAARLAETKTAAVAVLPPTTVHRLAAKSASPEIVDAVIAKAAAGEIVPDKTVQELLARARDEKAEAKREAGRREYEAQRAKRRTKAAREQRARLELVQELQREREAVARAAATLIRDLGVDGAALVHEVMTGIEDFAEPYDVLRELGKQLGEVQS